MYQWEKTPCRLGVSRPIYVNVDSPNLGFPYFLGGYLWKKTPCMSGLPWSWDDLLGCIVDLEFLRGRTDTRTKVLEEVLADLKIDTNECPNKNLWPIYLNILIYLSHADTVRYLQCGCSRHCGFTFTLVARITLEKSAMHWKIPLVFKCFTLGPPAHWCDTLTKKKAPHSRSSKQNHRNANQKILWRL